MDWQPVDKEEKDDLITKIDILEPAIRLAEETCALDFIPLDFYKESGLLRLTIESVPDAALWYVRIGGKVFILDGEMGCIHTCNEIAPLRLTDDNVYSYLKFLYYFSSGGRIFESRIRASSVGYTGKVWVFEEKGFFEQDINLSRQGHLVVLEKLPMQDVPEFEEKEFSL